MKIKNQDVQITRLGLRKWLELEAKESQIKKDKDNRIQRIFEYLEIATGQDIEFWKDVFWLDISQVLVEVYEANSLSIEFPMFTTPDREQKDDIPWDYPERTFYAWADAFSSSYGWELDTVSNLDPDDACGLLQEINTRDQLEREFEHSLSEMSYSYNKRTKKSKYMKLPRPKWMMRKAKKAKKTKIRKDMLPVGHIVNLEEKYGKKAKPK